MLTQTSGSFRGRWSGTTDRGISGSIFIRVSLSFNIQTKLGQTFRVCWVSAGNDFSPYGAQGEEGGGVYFHLCVFYIWPTSPPPPPPPPPPKKNESIIWVPCVCFFPFLTYWAEFFHGVGDYSTEDLDPKIWERPQWDVFGILGQFFNSISWTELLAMISLPYRGTSYLTQRKARLRQCRVCLQVYNMTARGI